jgi:hypothetical protein
MRHPYVTLDVTPQNFTPETKQALSTTYYHSVTLFDDFELNHLSM